MTPKYTCIALYIRILYNIIGAGVISISITIFNKAVLSHYQFPYANTLALGQMFFSLLFLEGMKRMHIVEYPAFSWSTAYKVR